LVNKATGEHVVHPGGGKQKSAKKSNVPKKVPAPATEEVPMAALGDDSEKENEAVVVDKGEGGSKGKGRAVFDEELSMVRRCQVPYFFFYSYQPNLHTTKSPGENAARKRERAISDDDDDTPPAQLHKHQKSDSSTRSTAR
jgi:hypothetical protein